MVFFSYQIAFVDKRPTVYAKGDELLMATVEKKQFQEYIKVFLTEGGQIMGCQPIEAGHA